MKLSSLLFVALPLASGVGPLTLRIIAQDDSRVTISSLTRLESDGHFAEVAEGAELLIADPALSVGEQGQAWVLLGVAYHQQGKFQKAASAYDQALRLLGTKPENAAHYAAVLIAYGTLYRDMGRSDDAERLQTRALHIYEQNRDGGGIAMACKSLAGVALANRHLPEARKYLDRAQKEAKDAPILIPDFFATLDDMRGTLAELESKKGEAVKYYANSLKTLVQAYGGKHVQVGWMYVKLGKAETETSHADEGLKDMRKGLLILNDTVGPANVRYLSAELMFAKGLDAAGDHAAAGELNRRSMAMLHSFYQVQCADCSVSAATLAVK